MDMIQRRDFLQSASANDPELWWYRRSGIKEGLLWHVQQRLWLLVTAEDSEPVLSFTCRRV